MDNRPTLVTRDDLSVSIAHESIDGFDASRRLLTAGNHRSIPIAENTVDRVHPGADRKSTRLNSSHGSISYAVFCLKKQNHNRHHSLVCRERLADVCRMDALSRR